WLTGMTEDLLDRTSEFAAIIRWVRSALSLIGFATSRTNTRVFESFTRYRSMAMTVAVVIGHGPDPVNRCSERGRRHSCHGPISRPGFVASVGAAESRNFGGVVSGT